VYGAYLLAIYNEDAEEFQTISKIGTGFSEKALEELAEGLRSHIIEAPRPYYRCAYAELHPSGYLALCTNDYCKWAGNLFGIIVPA
jgi:ATP-dependent DNA ligase